MSSKYKVALIAIGIVVLGIAIWHVVIVLIKILSFILICAACLIPAALIYGGYRVVKRFKK